MPAFGVLLVAAESIWVLASLGPRWTTRIIVLRDAPLVRRGPYRFVNHPNYAVVIGEIAVLPLVFGLWQVALIFTLLNAALLTIRIREENQTLATITIQNYFRMYKKLAGMTGTADTEAVEFK